MAKELIVSATGRRKESIARVRMKPGSGDFVVNDRTLDEYFLALQHRSRSSAASGESRHFLRRRPAPGSG